MTSFDEVVGNYEDPNPVWGVEVNGTDYTGNLELLEFEDSVNNPIEFTVKLAGVDGDVSFPKDSEVVVKMAGAELFRGVLQQVNPDMLQTFTLKGAGYASELQGDVEKQYQSTNVTNIVNDLVDGVSTNTNQVRTFSTSFNLNSTLTVDDFRVSKKQLQEVNRLMGEYSTEWYTTYDSNDDPVFNVVNQIQFDDGGNPLDTLTVYGPDQTAEVVGQNVNRNQGDFDGVVVRGYGDGDDQITATAGSTGKGNRVLIYTDKTILTSSQAQNRADKLNSSRTVDWQEIEVKTNNPNKLYSVGDLLTVDAKDAKLNDDYRVVNSYFKIWPGEDQFESKLTLSNKPQTFLSDFKTEKEKRESETDYMQGSRNVWSDKEASNATNASAFVMDFEVPQDVVDLAGNNRLDRIELNYASGPFQENSGKTTDVTASNFDPGTKVVSTGVQSEGIEVERTDIKNHNHPVGSATSTAASEIPVESVGNVDAVTVDSGGWTKIAESTESGGTSLSSVEDDKKHLFQIEISNIDTTSNLHFCILGEKGDTSSAAFSYSPSSPVTDEQIEFYSQTEVEGGEGNTRYFLWDFGDSGITSDGYSTEKLGEEVNHSYSSAGDYTVTLEYYEKGGVPTTIDSTDASTNEIEPNASNLGISEGDTVRIVRSSGNDGAYTVTNVDPGGSADGNDLITVQQDVNETYSDSDSDSVKGDLIYYVSPTSTASQTVSVTSASGLTAEQVAQLYDGDVTEEDVKRQNIKEDDLDPLRLMRELDKQDLLTEQKRKDLHKRATEQNEDNVSTQDKASMTVSFTLDASYPGENYGYLINGDDNFHSYSVTAEDSDSACSDTDVEFFWQKNTDSSYFEYQTELVGVDICTAKQFNNYGTDFTEDETTPFNGAGRYSSSVRINNASVGDPGVVFSASGQNSDPDEFFICSCIVESMDSYVNPDGDDESEVEFVVDGWYGEGVEGFNIRVGDADGSDTGTNLSLDDSGSINGKTIELMPGESDSFTINGVSHTVECTDTQDSFGDEARLTVDGTDEGWFDPGNTVVDEGQIELRVKDTTHQHDIVDRNGDDTGTDYSSVVLETYLNGFDRKVAGYSEGDYTATFRFIDSNADEIKDDFTASSWTHTDFTIDLNDPPDAQFSFSPSNPSVGEQVQFFDESADPDGDSTITKWEWDFDGDGNYEETITSSPGDTSHVYNSTGDRDVTLRVTDDAGATDTKTKTVSVQESETSFSDAYTVDTESVEDVGGTTTTVNSLSGSTEVDSQAVNLSDAYTVDTESYNQVGTQQTPASDVYAKLNIPVSQQYISDEYEVYVATQGSNSPTIDGVVRIWQLNHLHDIPRQDDFSDVDADVGAGAENKEVLYERATDDEGDVLLDFDKHDESITLDTTISGNDVTITVANEDSQGNLSNQEQISAVNGTATTTNTYQDEELFVRIDSAGDDDEFEVRNQTGDVSYRLAAASQANFKSSKENQKTDEVSAGDGSQETVLTGIDTGLVEGVTANNYKIFIDDDPDNDATNSEQEITGDLYGGASDSGTAKDKELDLSSYVDSPGWYRLRLVPDQPTFTKARVFLDHHKDSNAN